MTSQRLPMNAQVRLMSSLGPLLSPHVDKFNNIIKLSLLATPYSIAFLLFFQEKGQEHLLMISSAAIIKCQNTWHKPVGLVSEQGHHFVSSALFSYIYIYIYIYLSHLLPHFSYFIIADLQRESLSL